MTCEKDKAIPCDAVSCAPSRPGCSGPNYGLVLLPQGDYSTIPMLGFFHLHIA